MKITPANGGWIIELDSEDGAYRHHWILTGTICRRIGVVYNAVLRIIRKHYDLPKDFDFQKR